MISRSTAGSRDFSSDPESLPLYNTNLSSTINKGSPRVGLGKGMSAAGAPPQQATQIVQQMYTGLWTVAAPLLPVAVLCIGIYVTSLEAGPGRPIDRQRCSCDCWDGRWVPAVGFVNNQSPCSCGLPQRSNTHHAAYQYQGLEVAKQLCCNVMTGMTVQSVG